MERTHKVLVEYLRCFCKERQTEWDQWVPFAIFTYNTTPHTKLKYTPYEVLFGRKANLPGNLQRAPQVSYCYDNYVKEVKQKFQSVWQRAKDNLRQSKEQTVEGSKSHTFVPKYNVGEHVLVRNEQRKKLDPLWLGPYEIREINGVNVKLTKLGTNGRKLVQTHINRTKPCVMGLEWQCMPKVANKLA